MKAEQVAKILQAKPELEVFIEDPNEHLLSLDPTKYLPCPIRPVRQGLFNGEWVSLDDDNSEEPKETREIWVIG
jgi:hypothetical protein